MVPAKSDVSDRKYTDLLSFGSMAMKKGDDRSPLDAIMNFELLPRCLLGLQSIAC